MLNFLLRLTVKYIYDGRESPLQIQMKDRCLESLHSKTNKKTQVSKHCSIGSENILLLSVKKNI